MNQSHLEVTPRAQPTIRVRVRGKVGVQVRVEIVA